MLLITLVAILYKIQPVCVNNYDLPQKTKTLYPHVQSYCPNRICYCHRGTRPSYISYDRGFLEGSGFLIPEDQIERSCFEAEALGLSVWVSRLCVQLCPKTKLLKVPLPGPSIQGVAFLREGALSFKHQTFKNPDKSP